jgi:subtilisin-like proprotein convertase family protein
MTATNSSRAVGFAESVPLRTLEEEKPDPERTSRKKGSDSGEDRDINEQNTKRIRIEAPGAKPSPDGALSRALPTRLAIPSPSASFDGLNNADNAAAFGFRVSPPDTNMDVGPDHIVMTTNLLVRVYNKSGVALTPAFKMSTLFAGIGGACATSDDGDPIVLYDPLADRWLISQFCTIANPNNHQLIAISKTGDPTGAYYLYDFMMPNNKFNDYPKFGVWPDGYYMTDNQFNQAGTAFLGAGVFAFDRKKMLVGDPTAGFIYFDLATNPSTADAGGMLPSDLDGLNPPPAGAPNIFSYFTAGEFGDPGDGLRLFEFHADFVNPASSTFTERAESPISVAVFNPLTPGGRDDIEQPPPAPAGSELDSISDRLMHRLQYRNSGGHESLVLNHTVNVGTGTTLATHQAGVRYYELRRTGSGPWFVQEQATFAPDSNNRWMGSAAIDHQGNLAVGYSVSSTTTFPSIRYAGRLVTDPPGGLFQGEASIIAGTGVQTGTGSRWGDYSMMSVDPADDCTFWYTTEYYTAASQATSSVGWLTRIAAFKFTECTPVAQGVLQGTITNCATGQPIQGALIETINGFSQVSDATGGYSRSLAPGAYTVTASKALYGSAQGMVTITNGGTATLDLCLTPLPQIMAAGSQITAEGCSPANNAIDSGETVTVDLCLKNTGIADTANLTATLLPTGGVSAPSGPQNYGVIPDDGTTVVCKSFSFTADSSLVCGSTLTATLQLQDGSTNLGTVTYTFTVGLLNPYTTTANYSSGGISVPIPDLATIESPITIPDGGAVSDVNVRVRLNHTFDGDLNISLVHPDGTVVNLSSNNGGGGDNYGSGANNCSGTFTVFDDSAVAAITAGTAPFAGTFRPEQMLSTLNGKLLNGTWKLRIADTAGADVGTLFCWELQISRRLYVCCGVPGTPIIQSGGSALTAESCQPGNGAPDPGETVTVDLGVVNAGSGDTVNLVGTLLAGGGVLAPSGPQTYGAVAAGGPAVSRSFTFVADGACGGTVTATLQLQDGPTSLGTVTYTFQLGTTVTNTYGPFSNPASISIPNSGAASPYPSNITVSGILGTVTKVTARINNLSHTFPDDLDVLIVGPAGQKVILTSDAGGSLDLVNTTLTFDDSGPALPDSAQILSGTFSPTNFGTGDAFPAPAPAAPYGAVLADFNGTNPNGTWSLFVTDDAGGDTGSIAGGWSISFQTADPVCCTQVCTITCPQNVTSCNTLVNYPAPTITGICGVVSCVPPSGSVFPVGVTTVTCTPGSGTPCSFTVTAGDAVAPTITGASASPTSLWPPNHTMRDVTVNYTSSDNCSSTTCSLSVTSNEPVDGTGDGDTSPDWEIIDDHHVRLRAERSGNGNGRIYTITITCTDSAGNSATSSVTVVVAHNIGSPVSGSSFKINTPVNFAGTFWDIAGRSHTAQWVLGSLTKPGTVVEPSGSNLGRVTGSYTFPNPGIYRVRLNVTDNLGLTSYVTTAGDLEAIVVVYDPSAGYTIGGGWIASPAGAYPANPTLTGKVGFGFNSKYFKNATNPKGETWMRFNLAGVEFSALNYEYLSISGAKAQIRGFGKLNGDSGYNFILTVIDGNLPNGGGIDRVRLKIWNKNTGVIVYDNQMGASDAADPITPVGTSSSITVQK